MTINLAGLHELTESQVQQKTRSNWKSETKHTIANEDIANWRKLHLTHDRKNNHRD